MGTKLNEIYALSKNCIFVQHFEWKVLSFTLGSAIREYCVGGFRSNYEISCSLTCLRGTSLYFLKGGC